MMPARKSKSVLPMPAVACKSCGPFPVDHSLTCLSFCGQDEEHDPGEEFEEYLACCVCGDNGKLLRSPVMSRMKGRR